MQRCVDCAGGDCVEADLFLRVFAGEAEGDGVESPLGDHGDRCRYACDGVIDERGSNGCHAAACVLDQHLPECVLGKEEESLEVGGDEAAEVIDCVVRERLDREDTSVVDEMVDGAEGADCCLCDLLRCRWLTDVSVDECEIRCGREGGFGDAA